MNTQETEPLNFGNWVPGKMIAGPFVISAFFAALGALQWAFFIPAVLFLLIGAYFAAAWYLFSARGGHVQDRVQDLIVENLSWDGGGEVLDIGCGNGPLTIKLARCYPAAKITGLDYWGKNWDYSMHLSQENARRAGVDGRVTFRHGTASSLPFEDASFDVVVSNLTFHEVADTADKRNCIREALRVLRPGGVFVLQDLFLLRSIYQTPAELVKFVESLGGVDVEFVRTCDAAFVPGLVKLPFMVGTMAILKGRKAGS